jgi:hypothetical protein
LTFIIYSRWVRMAFTNSSGIKSTLRWILYFFFCYIPFGYFPSSSHTQMFAYYQRRISFEIVRERNMASYRIPYRVCTSERWRVEEGENDYNRRKFISVYSFALALRMCMLILILTLLMLVVPRGTQNTFLFIYYYFVLFITQ